MAYNLSIDTVDVIASVKSTRCRRNIGSRKCTDARRIGIVERLFGSSRHSIVSVKLYDCCLRCELDVCTHSLIEGILPLRVVAGVIIVTVHRHFGTVRVVADEGVFYPISGMAYALSLQFPDVIVMIRISIFGYTDNNVVLSVVKSWVNHVRVMCLHIPYFSLELQSNVFLASDTWVVVAPHTAEFAYLRSITKSILNLFFRQVEWETD